MLVVAQDVLIHVKFPDGIREPTIQMLNILLEGSVNMKSISRLFNGGFVVCAVGILFLAVTDARANLLVNPGFEDPVTSDGAPFVGSWEAFIAPGSAAFNSSTDPLSGLQHLELVIPGTADLYAGVFQDVEGMASGQQATFSGWAKNVGQDTGGVEIRIEWRDSVNNVEVSRTPNLTPVFTSQYTQWSLAGAVPAGADTARVVFAIQSFVGALDQTVYVDGTSLTVPDGGATLALLGFGLVGVIAVRRRTA